MVFREGVNSVRINVVFDDYQYTSIKNVEREKREAELANE